MRVLGESDFLWEDYLLVRPEDLLPMICNPSEWRRLDPAEMAAELEAALAEAGDHDARERALRRFRDHAVFRASFRAILRKPGDADTLEAELSEAAEVLLRAAFAVATAERAGTLPRTPEGEASPSAPVRPGQVRGPRAGVRLGHRADARLRRPAARRGPRRASPGAAFDALVSSLRRLLAGRRGTTFDLDFRLRPHGRAGPPATSIRAFADYYRGDGPAWGYERQALIKLRPIAGDPALIAEVEALRDRFVYGPEPFDLEGFRRLRRLQVEQRVPTGRISAKFSPGALVDVEYFVQVLQIAHGGRRPEPAHPQHPGGHRRPRHVGTARAGDRRDPPRWLPVLPRPGRRPPGRPRPRPGPDRAAGRLGGVRPPRPADAPPRSRRPRGRDRATARGDPWTRRPPGGVYPRRTLVTGRSGAVEGLGTSRPPARGGDGIRSCWRRSPLRPPWSPAPTRYYCSRSP